MNQSFLSGPAIVSAIVVAGFVTLIVLLVVSPIKLEEHVAQILNILTGTLAAKFGDVVQYHVGSSAGSKAKDDVLKGIVSEPKNQV